MLSCLCGVIKSPPYEGSQKHTDAQVTNQLPSSTSRTLAASSPQPQPEQYNNNNKEPCTKQRKSKQRSQQLLIASAVGANISLDKKERMLSFLSQQNEGTSTIVIVLFHTLDMQLCFLILMV